MNNAKTTTPAGPESVGDQIAAAMLAAFREAAKANAPVRASKGERDPWEGVRLSTAETEAVARLGWAQRGWRIKESQNRTVFPEHLKKSGPQVPDPKKVVKGQVTAEGFAVYQVRAMLCAKLAQYGKLSVGHSALIINAMGAGDKHNAFSCPSKLAAHLQATLKTKVSRTEDGFYECQVKGYQAMHDTLIQCADLIIKSAK